MRRALAMTHVEFEDLGSLEPELTRAGYAIESIDACIADLPAIDPLRPDLLVILGGPIGVYEQEAYPFLDAELNLIRLRLAEKRPTLGICLGAQLIAAATGASVYSGTQGKEIGWGSISAGPDVARYPEFAGLLTPGLQVLHWHGDTFNLPTNAYHLARTSAYSNQAFAIDRHVLGLQFHTEVTARGLERWYVGHACELGSAGIEVPLLRQQSKTFAPALEDAAQRFWREWLSRL
jgi:GMP synthase (glutamine-hydrolysing)